jgi:hypothetical protein
VINFIRNVTDQRLKELDQSVTQDNNILAGLKMVVGEEL